MTPMSVAFAHAAVDADAGAGRLAVEQQRSGLRQEAAGGILGIDPALDGVAALRQLLLPPRQRLAAGDPQLRPDQVDAGHRFGDRMLDLQPRVHLEKVEARRVAFALDQELDRAGVAIADGARGGDGRVSHPGAEPGVETATEGLSSMTFWCRRWSEHSRSNRWTTLPCASAEDLDLDVPRPLDQPLDVERAVAERRGRLAPRRADGFDRVLVASTRRMPLPPPPAEALTRTG